VAFSDGCVWSEASAGGPGLGEGGLSQGGAEGGQTGFVDWAIGGGEGGADCFAQGFGCAVEDGGALPLGPGQRLAQPGRPEAALAPLDLKARHVGVLVALEEREPAAQHELSQLLRIDRTLVAIVDHLERLSLVEGGVQPADRRTHQVRRTAAGRAATETAPAAMTAADGALVQRLSVAELAQLVTLLHKLYLSD
jgi:DNA-binding MarR family transcriptional regulator